MRLRKRLFWWLQEELSDHAAGGFQHGREFDADLLNDFNWNFEFRKGFGVEALFDGGEIEADVLMGAERVGDVDQGDEHF